MEAEMKQMSREREAAAIAEFRTALEDLLPPDYDDVLVKKWLKARSFDVNKSVAMYRSSHVYKKKMKVETLMAEYQPPEVLQKYLPGGFAGFDKEGSPVLIELFGYLDVKGLLYSARREDIEKTKLLLGEQVMQLLDEQTKKTGKLVEGMTVIIDMDQVGLSMLWGPGMEMIAHMGKVVQDNYPEVVKRSFIVNAPRIFPMLWKMIRPLVTEDMKRKVCILGADYEKELLTHIEADQLPAFLGGTMTDPDGNPRCPSRIVQGGTVPEEYYLKELTSTDHMKSTSIPHGEKLELVYQVNVPGSVLRWDFKTDGYDIGFGVNKEDPVERKKSREKIIPVSRVNSHTAPESGSITCEGKMPMLYSLIFDNTYSWSRGKTLYYVIDVLPPEDTSDVRELDMVTLGGSWGKVAEKTEDTAL